MALCNIPHNLTLRSNDRLLGIVRGAVSSPSLIARAFEGGSRAEISSNTDIYYSVL